MDKMNDLIKLDAKGLIHKRYGCDRCNWEHTPDCPHVIDEGNVTRNACKKRMQWLINSLPPDLSDITYSQFERYHTIGYGNELIDKELKKISQYENTLQETDDPKQIIRINNDIHRCKVFLKDVWRLVLHTHDQQVNRETVRKSEITVSKSPNPEQFQEWINRGVIDVDSKVIEDDNEKTKEMLKNDK